jgi:2-methylcitrate dehydratase PrpD
VDDAMDEASVDITVTCTDGRKLHVFVEHAIGSVQKPMTNQQLEAKFDGLVVPVLGQQKSDALKATCWKLAQLPSMVELVGTAKP